MRTGVKIAIGVGIGLVAALGYGYVAYRRAADLLDVSLQGVRYDHIDRDGSLLLDLTLKVNNPSGLEFPVPTLTAELFAGTQHLATGQSENWQFIMPKAITYLTVPARISLTEAGPYLYNVVLNQDWPADLNMKGVIHLGGYDVDFQTQLIQISQ